MFLGENPYIFGKLNSYCYYLKWESHWSLWSTLPSYSDTTHYFCSWPLAMLFRVPGKMHLGWMALGYISFRLGIAIKPIYSLKPLIKLMDRFKSRKTSTLQSMVICGSYFSCYFVLRGSVNAWKCVVNHKMLQINIGKHCSIGRYQLCY